MTSVRQKIMPNIILICSSNFLMTICRIRRDRRLRLDVIIVRVVLMGIVSASKTATFATKGVAARAARTSYNIFKRSEKKKSPKRSGN